MTNPASHLIDIQTRRTGRRPKICILKVIRVYLYPEKIDVHITVVVDLLCLGDIVKLFTFTKVNPFSELVQFSRTTILAIWL